MLERARETDEAFYGESFRQGKGWSIGIYPHVDEPQLRSLTLELLPRAGVLRSGDQATSLRGYLYGIAWAEYGASRAIGLTTWYSRVLDCRPRHGMSARIVAAACTDFVEHRCLSRSSQQCSACETKPNVGLRSKR